MTAHAEESREDDDILALHLAGITITFIRLPRPFYVH